MRQRLANLEKAAREQGRRSCRLCNGEPWATVYEVYDSSWGDSGGRGTPRYYLSDEKTDRITDELCCRQCGAPVAERDLLILMFIDGIGWPPPNGSGGHPLRPEKVRPGAHPGS